jgi:hypothetical protein
VHPAEDLIPVLIAGNPETTYSTNNADMAFPAALCERLELPLASDYRGFDPKSSKLHSARYRTSWYKLLADICNCSRAEIERREGPAEIPTENTMGRRCRRNLDIAGRCGIRN